MILVGPFSSGYPMILMDISTHPAWDAPALMMAHSTSETLATPPQLSLLLQEPLAAHLGASEPSPELRARLQPEGCLL